MPASISPITYWKYTDLYASVFWFVALFVAPGERPCGASLSGRGRAERSKSSNGPGNHVYGQRPNNGPSHPWSGAAPGAYSMSGVVGHRVHGEDPTQNAHGTSGKLMLVVDNGRGMAHHADAIGSDGRQYATEGQGGAADRRRGGDQGRIDGFWWRSRASLCARGRQGGSDRHPRRSGRARGGCAPCRWP